MGGRSKKVTVGYRYYMALHFGICHGPVDALLAIRVGDRLAWSAGIGASGTISINNGDLFGGDEREGGIIGDADVMFGGAAQGQNAYLVEQLGADIPAYRGILSLVYKVQAGANTVTSVFKSWLNVPKGQVSANNPYVKPWAFKVKRILQGWSTGTAWYSAKATISTYDMNPAHILYQCLTDTVWGMGYPTQQIDDASFTAAADTLYSEGFGLSMIWNQQAKIGDFIGNVLDHIGAVLYVDQTTGKFAIKLIRGDYSVPSLPLFDESNVVELASFQRVGYGETVNEVTVVFRDRNKADKDSAVTVQDLANIQAQGAVVAQTKQYPGITSPTIAARVAMRDLISASTPLSKIRLKVNRYAWDLIPGDVFRFNWTKLGLTSVAYRVLAIDYGTLEDGTITVDAAEDVFGLPTNSYAAQQPTEYTEQSGAPTAVTAQEAFEAPYYELVRSMSNADLAIMDAVDGAFCGTLAARPSNTVAINYRQWSKVGAADYAERGLFDYTPTATLEAEITPTLTTTVLQLTGASDLGNVQVGDLCIIGEDMATAEWTEVSVIDLDNLEVTVYRGALDTTPKTWAVGTRVWFVGSSLYAIDETERATGETVDFKLTTIATGGELDITDGTITAVSVTANQRFARPYVPGNFKLNSSAYPTYITGQLVVSWAHRDRTQQTADVTHQDEASIGPEATVTYTIKVYDRGGDLVHTQTGETGTSWTYATATEQSESDDGMYNGRLRVTVEAVRGGLTSWQAQDHTFDRAGYGLNYGMYYGAGV